jgi:protein-S-isoprenylcysteine O-methyltransferase Ste14
MWIVRVILLGLLIASVAVFGVFLRRRAEAGFGRVLENRPVNLLGVIAYNLACYLLAALPSAPGVFSAPAFLADPFVAGGFLAAGLGLSVLAAAFMIAAVRQRKTVGGENVKAGLLTDGVYRFARHPIYMAIFGMSFGLALVFRSWDGILMLPFILAINLLEGGIEERYDIGLRFPVEYEAFRKRTRPFGSGWFWTGVAAILLTVLGVSFL